MAGTTNDNLICAVALNAVKTLSKILSKFLQPIQRPMDRFPIQARDLAMQPVGAIFKTE
jgi:hypothetical protein